MEIYFFAILILVDLAVFDLSIGVRNGTINFLLQQLAPEWLQDVLL